MAMRPQSLVRRLLLSVAFAVAAFYALVFVGAYIHLLVPSGTVKLLGPNWYFLLASLFVGSLVGSVLGATHRRLLVTPSIEWAIGCSLIVAASYMWLLTDRDWLAPAPGWWIPLVDLSAFTATFLFASATDLRSSGRAGAI